MTKLLRFIFLTALVAAFALPAPVSAQCGMKNVILFIGDGWGYNQIAATDYWHGVNKQVYEQFPVCYAVSTYSWTVLQEDPAGYNPEEAWTDFYYMLWRATDSAAAATAISTGVKAEDGQISVHPQTGAALLTVVQRAEQLGKATGVVTSVPWSHATPAGFAAHDVSRDNYVAIAREMIDSSNCEVIMGCGHPEYNYNGVYVAPSSENSYRYVGGSAKWNQLRAGTAGQANGHPSPWTLIETRAQFQNLITNANPPARICGTVRVAETLQQKRTPTEAGNSFTPPYTVPLLTTVPTLAEMTRGALNVLDGNPNGFFLMVESGAIDNANHSNQMGRCIEEMDALAAAVSAVVEWVGAHSNWRETLVIVTGDHETGYLWGTDSGSPAVWNPLVNNGANNMPDGRYYSGGHSNSIIPLFAKGVGSAWLNVWADRLDPVRGYYLDNTDIANLIFGYYDCSLPVELESFTAEPVQSAIQLRWRTASETDNDRFEIFRDDRLIVSVSGNGNSPNGHSYSWLNTDVIPGVSYSYTLYSVDFDGTRRELAHAAAAAEEANASTMQEFALHPNYPNPFNAATVIRFDLPHSGFVSLRVFDLMGRQVAALVNGEVAAGSHTVMFRADGLPSGVYVCALDAETYHARTKMMLLK
jgi:alkaline phosphatase